MALRVAKPGEFRAVTTFSPYLLHERYPKVASCDFQFASGLLRLQDDLSRKLLFFYPILHLAAQNVHAVVEFFRGTGKIGHGDRQCSC